MPPDAAEPTHLVVFDFDGTVAVGDGPVEAYLEAVLAAAAQAGAARRGEARAALAAHLAGRDDVVDGYALVARQAARLGVAEARRRAAYDRARAALVDGGIAVEAPPGLGGSLRARPAGVAAAIVTNAPAAGIDAVLDRLCVAVDAVVGDAGKPAGLPAILHRLRGALPARRVLAVGDIWVNDLEPAAALGAATAYVDRHGRGDGEPTFRARTLTELLPAIEGWWSA